MGTCVDYPDHFLSDRVCAASLLAAACMAHTRRLHAVPTAHHAASSLAASLSRVGGRVLSFIDLSLVNFYFHSAATCRQRSLRSEREKSQKGCPRQDRDSPGRLTLTRSVIDFSRVRWPPVPKTSRRWSVGLQDLLFDAYKGRLLFSGSCAWAWSFWRDVCQVCETHDDIASAVVS